VRGYSDCNDVLPPTPARVARPVLPALLDKRLVFVTGKGGVGKSTVAAALGVAAARHGKRTIVCEVAQQERMSQVFGHDGAGYRETEVGPDLFSFSIDPQRALEEYLMLQIKIRPLYDLMFKNRVFTYFAAATPGLRELVTVGKVWELAQLDRRVKRSSKYDLVIVDAPATGHGLGLLRTPKTFSDIARVGPIKRQADAIYNFITDESQTGVCAVAWPEEMPVNETLDLQGRLQDELGMDLDRIFMNGIYPELFSEAEVKTITERYEQALAAAGSNGGIELVRKAALRAALSEAARARMHRDQLARLEHEARQDVVELPFLFEPRLDMDAVERLADRVEEAL
jgi:anion-transporting  ArsA/GET3 family ATPase